MPDLQIVLESAAAAMIFYGTFKHGQPLSAHFVKLEAHNWSSAAEILSLMYQDRWDCCFPASDAHLVGDRTEVRFGSTKPEQP